MRDQRHLGVTKTALIRPERRLQCSMDFEFVTRENSVQAEPADTYLPCQPFAGFLNHHALGIECQLFVLVISGVLTGDDRNRYFVVIILIKSRQFGMIEAAAPEPEGQSEQNQP
jgi:hypothetical protein